MNKTIFTLTQNAANENTGSFQPENQIYQNLSSQLGPESIGSRTELATTGLFEETTLILAEPSFRAGVLMHLMRMQQILTRKIEWHLRPSVFRELNCVLKALHSLYLNDTQIYTALFAITTMLKDQIDAYPQDDAELSVKEWEELERSVYLLCDWEDSIGTLTS
jgi:hypothetical protein